MRFDIVELSSIDNLGLLDVAANKGFKEILVAKIIEFRMEFENLDVRDDKFLIEFIRLQTELRSMLDLKEFLEVKFQELTTPQTEE